MPPSQLSGAAILLAMGLVLFAGCEPPAYSAPAKKASPASAASAPAVLVPLPDFTALVKNQGAAVVNISSTRQIKGRTPVLIVPGLSPDDPLYELFRRFGADGSPREFRSQSLGSGFIIDQEGYVLTNSHVVEDADEVTVGLTDKREFKAKLIGTDKRGDVALLKISATNLPVVKIGDSSVLEVGQWVVAIGAPFGFTNSVTQGIVSATARDLPGDSVVPFIQTDVSINPGSSGGPLFNMNGEVVGINSQIYSQNGGSIGISFAIPIDAAMKIKEQLLKHGSVRRGKLGVTIQDVSPELAESFGLEKAGGALITALEKGGPAERAGLRVGDIVQAFDGKEVADSVELPRRILEAAPGTKARLKVWRDGAAQEIVVSLGEAGVVAAKAPKPRSLEPDRLGLSLRELSPAEQHSNQGEGTVFVEAVEGVAASSGIEPGDIILTVNNRPVASIEQFRAELNKAGKRVALLIQRDIKTKIFISLNLKGE